MFRFNDYLTVVFIGIYLINRFLFIQTGNVFTDNYLNDILAIPVVLTLSRWCMQLIYRIKEYRLSVLQITGICAYMSVVFEFLLPQYSTVYSGDWLDVCCYFMGGLIYYLSSRLS